jgi:hypothetical protein
MTTLPLPLWWKLILSYFSVEMAREGRSHF